MMYPRLFVGGHSSPPSVNMRGGASEIACFTVLLEGRALYLGAKSSPSEFREYGHPFFDGGGLLLTAGAFLLTVEFHCLAQSLRA